MFVVDVAVLLPHPPHVVARVVERLHVLPRWCGGLRRARHLSPDADAAGCVFTYSAAELRLTLAARTVERTAGADGGPPALVRHRAEGDGVTLTWTLTAEPAMGGGGVAPLQLAAGAPSGPLQTRLRARVALEVDPAHATAAARPALSRLLARRVPADLDRLGVLLARYEYGKAHAIRSAAGVTPDDVPLAPATDARVRPHRIA